MGRHGLRVAATKVLWDKREMLPEYSEEIVDDVLGAVLPLIVAALGEMPGQWAHYGRQGAADWLEMTFGTGEPSP